MVDYQTYSNVPTRRLLTLFVKGILCGILIIGEELNELDSHYTITQSRETGRANIEYIDTPMIFLSDWAFSDATQNTYNLSFTKPNHPNRAAWSDSSDRDIHVVNVSLCLPTVRVMTGLHTYMITVYVFMVTSDVCL